MRRRKNRYGYNGTDINYLRVQNDILSDKVNNQRTEINNLQGRLAMVKDFKDVYHDQNLNLCEIKDELETANSKLKHLIRSLLLTYAMMAEMNLCIGEDSYIDYAIRYSNMHWLQNMANLIPDETDDESIAEVMAYRDKLRKEQGMEKV